MNHPGATGGSAPDSAAFSISSGSVASSAASSNRSNSFVCSPRSSPIKQAPGPAPAIIALLRAFSTGENPCHTELGCTKLYSEVDPVAFKIGPLTIHWYGVLVALGFLIGLWMASRRGLREGIAPEKIMDIGPWLIIGTIIGARTLHVISYWDAEFAGKPWTEVFMVHKGGLVYYGGFIGATLTGIGYLTWKKLPVWKFGDILAPSIPVGYALGRMGCLANGC